MNLKLENGLKVDLMIELKKIRKCKTEVLLLNLTTIRELMVIKVMKAQELKKNITFKCYFKAKAKE